MTTVSNTFDRQLLQAAKNILILLLNTFYKTLYMKWTRKWLFGSRVSHQDRISPICPRITCWEKLGKCSPLFYTIFLTGGLSNIPDNEASSLA